MLISLGNSSTAGGGNTGTAASGRGVQKRLPFLRCLFRVFLLLNIALQVGQARLLDTLGFVDLFAFFAILGLVEKMSRLLERDADMKKNNALGGGYEAILCDVNNECIQYYLPNTVCLRGRVKTMSGVCVELM